LRLERGDIRDEVLAGAGQSAVAVSEMQTNGEGISCGEPTGLRELKYELASSARLRRLQ